MKATGGTRERDYPPYLPTLPPSPRIITMVYDDSAFDGDGRLGREERSERGR